MRRSQSEHQHRAEQASEPLAESTTKVAFRNVKLVQEPLVDQEGTSFLFEINGIRVFCGGSNWIPADSFLTDISDKRYRDWVQLMVSSCGLGSFTANC